MIFSAEAVVFSAIAFDTMYVSPPTANPAPIAVANTGAEETTPNPKAEAQNATPTPVKTPIPTDTIIGVIGLICFGLSVACEDEESDEDIEVDEFD